MTINQFEVCGQKETRVIHVAFRTNLFVLASDHCLQIACQNKSRENKVIVVIQGEKQDIQNFYNSVKTFNPQLFVDKKSYTVTQIVEYSGITPHWDQNWEEISRENMLTGVSYLKGMGSDMKEIKTMFVEQQKRFHIIGQGIQSVKQDMDTLKETASTLKSIDTKLESLQTISKFLKQFIDGKK